MSASSGRAYVFLHAVAPRRRRHPARISNDGDGKIKFNCDAMTAMDPAETVVVS
ncbi:hypothetical protein [Methylibium sp. Root1272]|uniref:hypothetical protein n=1 Tax=Methylibium sp. Root1272 TaxID=1736441 RepID=UPI001F31402D|nr:hypothetical protein [Methylibium sp. Root1272]